jgi:hypothetical protein
MLLRCSVHESARIRLAAKRRGVTISAFVIHTLRSSWEHFGPTFPIDEAPGAETENQGVILSMSRAILPQDFAHLLP